MNRDAKDIQDQIPGRGKYRLKKNLFFLTFILSILFIPVNDFIVLCVSASLRLKKHG